MNFGDLPYGPLRAALDTIFGRIGLMYGVLAIAAMLGGWTAGASFLEGLGALVGMPILFGFSFLFGYGLVACPLLLLFGVAFVRGDWRWRWLIVPLIIAWWNFHEVIEGLSRQSDSSNMQSL